MRTTDPQGHLAQLEQQLSELKTRFTAALAPADEAPSFEDVAALGCRGCQAREVRAAIAELELAAERAASSIRAAEHERLRTAAVALVHARDQGSAAAADLAHHSLVEALRGRGRSVGPRPM